MPESLRRFAFRILRDNATIPKKKKQSLLHRDTLFRALTKRVNKRLGFPMGEGKPNRSDTGSPPSSAALVRAVLIAFGIHLNMNNALSLLNKSSQRERNPTFYRGLLSPHGVTSAAGSANRLRARARSTSPSGRGHCPRGDSVGARPVSPSAATGLKPSACRYRKCSIDYPFSLHG